MLERFPALPPWIRATLASGVALAGVFVAPAAAQDGNRMSGGSTVLLRHAMDSAGQRLEGGGVTLGHAVGLVGFTTASGGEARLQGGLKAHIAQPGSVVALSAVSKATGTLELAWTSPGRDGALGAVIGGSWRLDYSSNPAHAFAPTRYELEIATDTSLGERRSVRIEDLAPNTTYYARVYLGDASRLFSEDSAPSAESTLANAPVAPTVVEVSSTHIVLRWLPPLGGARQGYRLEGSSTSFGALTPGGDLLEVATPDDAQLRLTLDSLITNTTYFLRVAALNAQGQRNDSVFVIVPTGLSHAPLAVLRLDGLTDALSRSVTLNWTNQLYVDPTGVLVVLSSSPAVTVTDGVALTLGQLLPDGSIVKSTASASDFRDGGLALDTTYFYHLFSQSSGPRYSVRVTTALFLDLPPMAPAGLASEQWADGTQVRLSWRGVRSNVDGSRFLSGVPLGVELGRYEVLRATSVVQPGYVRVATVPADTLSYIDTVPDPRQFYLYKVSALDSLGTSDTSMAVSSNGDLYVHAPDGSSHLRVPRALALELLARGGSPDILLRGRELPSSPGEPIFRNIAFDAVASPGNAPVRHQFSQPNAEVTLRYEVVGGRIVPAAQTLDPPAGPTRGGPSLSEAATSLGLYWDNGTKFVKLFGSVDAARQVVTVQTGLTGNFQIRSLLREPGFSFDISSLSNRFITPNGDGLNDTAVFVFDNPRDSAFSGRVFNVRGMHVADMGPGPLPRTSLAWDGMATGKTVPGGVYVYRIEAEGKAFTGTLVVVR